MFISASVRPHGLKRGTTDKKLGKMLGFEGAVGLTEVCGRLELSATRPSDFFFLKEMWMIMGMLNKGGSITVKDKNGKVTAEYKSTADEEDKESA